MLWEGIQLLESFLKMLKIMHKNNIRKWDGYLSWKNKNTGDMKVWGFRTVNFELQNRENLRIPKAEVQECCLLGMLRTISLLETQLGWWDRTCEKGRECIGCSEKDGPAPLLLVVWLGQGIQPLCASVSVWVLVNIKRYYEFGAVLGT